MFKNKPYFLPLDIQIFILSLFPSNTSAGFPYSLVSSRRGIINNVLHSQFCNTMRVLHLIFSFGTALRGAKFNDYSLVCGGKHKCPQLDLTGHIHFQLQTSCSAFLNIHIETNSSYASTCSCLSFASFAKRQVRRSTAQEE